MKHLITLLLLGAFHQFAASQPGSAHNPQGSEGLSRLSEGDVLLTSADLSVARLDKCQPLKGTTVAVLQVQTIGGLNAANVQVAEGRCSGVVGWVPLRSLEMHPSTQR